MIINAVVGVVITFIVLVALLYIGLNTVIFIGVIMVNEIKSKYLGGDTVTSEETVREISDVDWSQVFVYQSDYWYIYIVVGTYALLKFTLYTIKTLKEAVVDAQTIRRKEKEASIARKVNHERKMLEYKAQVEGISNKTIPKTEEEQKPVEYYSNDNIDYSVPQRKNQSTKPMKSKARPRSEIVADTQEMRQEEADDMTNLTVDEDSKIQQDVEEVITHITETAQTVEPLNENIDIINTLFEEGTQSLHSKEEEEVETENSTSRPKRNRQRKPTSETDTDESVTEEAPRMTLIEIQKARKELIMKEQAERQQREAEEVARVKQEREKQISERQSRMGNKSETEDEYEINLKGFGNQD